MSLIGSRIGGGYPLVGSTYGVPSYGVPSYGVPSYGVPL